METNNSFACYGTATAVDWVNKVQAVCPVHGEIKGWPTIISSSNGTVTICWLCLGDFYANNLPRVERV